MKSNESRHVGVEDRLQSRLAKLRRRVMGRAIFESLLFFVAIVFWVLTVTISLEATFYFQPFWRSLLLSLAFLLPILLVVRRFIYHLKPVINIHRFVLSIESEYPELKQRLVTALELHKNSEFYNLYSSSLINATFQSAENHISSIRSRDLFVHIDYRRALCNVMIASIAPILLFLWSTESITNSIHRCLNPTSNFFRPPETRVVIEADKTEVVRGNDLFFIARFIGELPAFASLMVYENNSKPPKIKDLVLQDRNELHYTFKNVEQSFSFQVSGGDGESARHRITVLEPPIIEHMNIRIKYPNYCDMPDRLVSGSGDIEALTNTQFLFEFEANRELAEAYFIVDDTLRYPAQINGKRAYKNWVLDRDIVYSLNIMDVDSLKNKEPIKYNLWAIEDEYPTVSIVNARENEEFPENSKIELVIDAQDDFGIKDLFIVFELNEYGKTRDRVPISLGRNILTNYSLDLSKVTLMPGDKIKYYAEVFDNDSIAGPKLSHSKYYFLRIPSIKEYYLKRDRLIQERLEEIMEMSSENSGLEEYFEDVRREVLRSEELTWERKHELDSVLKSQEAQVNKINEFSDKLAENMGTINGENSFDKKTAQKVRKIRNLMDEVVASELREALSNIRNKIEAFEAEDLAESLNKFIEDQITFQRQLDRAIQILTQIKVEQELNALVSRSLESYKIQKQINEKIDDKELGISEQKQQGFLRNELQSIRRSIEQLTGKMESINRQISSRLESQSGQLEKNNFESRMLEMVKKMRSKSSQVKKIGKDLEDDLGMFSAGMEAIRGEFIAEQTDSVNRDLTSVGQNLLVISHKQEELFSLFSSAGDSAMVVASEDQMALLSSLKIIINSLAEIGRRTMTIEAGLKFSLGHALKGMNKSVVFLGQRDLQQAKEFQWRTLVSLNEAIVLLGQSLSNSEHSSMSSSFGEAMQKMLGMSEQQSKINQMGSGIFKKLGLRGSGRIKKDIENQIQRLSTEQERILADLEDLQRSLQGEPIAQAKIRELREEVVNVLDDLRQGRINQRTLTRQDKIFRQMLEASNSLHTRGQKKQRQGREGEDMSYLGPPGLPEDLGQAEDLLRQSMKRALESDYPGEYRDLLKEYYEKIYRDMVEELENSR